MVGTSAQQGANLSHGSYDHVRFTTVSFIVSAPADDGAHVGQEAHTMHQAPAMQEADTTVKGHAMGEIMSNLILYRGANWLKLHRLKQLLPAKERALCSICSVRTSESRRQAVHPLIVTFGA